MTPLLSDKIVSNEKITLVEKETFLLSNIIKSLGVPQYNQANPICQNVKDPVINAIIKCRNCSGIIPIKKSCTNSKFSFWFIEKKDILKEIKNLWVNKATRDSDVRTKLIKNNLDFFADFIFSNLNDSLGQSMFPILMKLENITSGRKRARKHQKITIGQLVYYQLFRKNMKDLCSSKRLHILSLSFQNFNVILGKVLAPSSAFCQNLRLGISFPLTWPLDCKIKCIQIQYWFTKIDARPFIES